MTERIRAKRGEARQFAVRSSKHSSYECFLWPYGQMTGGYGGLYDQGKIRPAHRVILELSLGRPLTDGTQAAHKPKVCHNRLCVNPRHLYEATPRQNQFDRRIDGTTRSGESVNFCKLTEDQAGRIILSSEATSVLARKFGVVPSTISEIKSRRNWKHHSSWSEKVGAA